MGKTYISPSGLAKEVQKIYYGNANNLAQEISKVYVGDQNGIARLVFGNSAILPREYQQVEWIYTASYGPYINTNLIPNTSAKIEAKMQFTEKPAGINTRCYCGAKNTIGSYYPSDSRIGYYYNSSTSSYLTVQTTYYVTTNSQRATSLTLSFNTNIHIYIIDYKNRCVALDNNSKNFSQSGTNGIPNVPFFLFAQSLQSANDYTNRSDHLRLYYFKWYSNDQITRTFYPCYRKSDNVVGLYEIFTNTFFTNNGSGSFTAGPNYIGEL